VSETSTAQFVARQLMGTHHDCYLNWSALSSAMQADIMLEGFEKAYDQHGLSMQIMLLNAFVQFNVHKL